MPYTPLLSTTMNRTKADGDGPPDQNNPYIVNNAENPVTTLPGGQDTVPGGGGGGGGGFQLPDWVRNQMRNFDGAMSNPMMIPSLAAAFQQFRQSRQYTDMAEHYANDPGTGLNPFGSQRPMYQGLLADTFNNPSKVLQNPAYQAFKTQGLNDIGRADASKGYMGSGNMMKDLYDYSSSKDLAYLNQQQQNLMTPAGANIGPQSAAAMLMMGLQGRMGAENNAVGNLMAPFMNQSRNNDVNNGNPNGPNGNNPNGNGRNNTNYDQQARNLLNNPNSLPEAMRSWSPQQLSQWLRFNQPLGNDSWGRFLTRGGGGDGTVDGGGDDPTWQIPDHGDGTYGPPTVGDNNDLMPPPGMGDADGNMGLDPDNWDLQGGGQDWEDWLNGGDSTVDFSDINFDLGDIFGGLG